VPVLFHQLENTHDRKFKVKNEKCKIAIQNSKRYDGR
jgi:hypothetical protein